MFRSRSWRCRGPALLPRPAGVAGGASAVSTAMSGWTFLQPLGVAAANLVNPPSRLMSGNCAERSTAFRTITPNASPRVLIEIFRPQQESPRRSGAAIPCSGSNAGRAGQTQRSSGLAGCGGGADESRIACWRAVVQEGRGPALTGLRRKELELVLDAFWSSRAGRRSSATPPSSSAAGFGPRQRRPSPCPSRSTRFRVHSPRSRRG